MINGRDVFHGPGSQRTSFLTDRRIFLAFPGSLECASSSLVVVADGGSAVEVIASSLVAVRSLDVELIDGEELPAVVLELEQLCNAVHALSAAVLDKFQTNGGWAEDGALSAAAWTAERTGSARAGLRSRVRQGAALRQLPAVAAEAYAGRLSTEHLRAMSDCARRHPAARRRPRARPARAGQDAEGRRVPAGDPPLARRRRRRPGRHSSRPSERQVSTAARLADVRGLAADRRAPRTARRRPRRSGARRRRRPRPARRPRRRPQRRRPARLGAAGGGAGRSRRPGDAPRTLRRLRPRPLPRRRHRSSGRAGDPRRSGLRRRRPTGSALTAEGEVLDVGRQTSRWPVGIRRAITVRDRGCVFPGCDRPPSWTDIHHCTPWREGGPTSVDNGALLCRRHHTFIHQHALVDHHRPRPTNHPKTRRHAIHDQTLALRQPRLVSGALLDGQR